MNKSKLLSVSALALFLTAGFTGCGDYDDSALTNRVENLEDRVTSLETLCNQINTNVASLQTLVNALQQQDYITGVQAITENGKEIGYSISFKYNNSITIYHGQDGQDGQNGQDGISPVIGVAQDTDGIYYWTLNGDWLLDSTGQKLKAEGTDGINGQDGAAGQDGVTPQVKVEDGRWMVSYDNGATWTDAGEASTTATGVFQSVEAKDAEVVFTLADGTSFALARAAALSIQLNTDLQSIQAGATVQIPYTLTGADANTVVTASSDGNYRVKVVKESDAAGYIEVTAPSTYADGFVNVLLSDGKGWMAVYVINFYEEVMTVANSEDETLGYYLTQEASTMSLPIDVNCEYDIVIPEEDKSWIQAEATTRAAVVKQNLNVTIAANTTGASRFSSISLKPKNSVQAPIVIPVAQRASTATKLETTFPGYHMTSFNDYQFRFQNGFLTSVLWYGLTTTFQYLENGLLIVEDNGNSKHTLKVTLNDQGWAEKASVICSYKDGSSDGFIHNYAFTYDSEGHLTKIIDDSENRHTLITWENGDITDVLIKLYTEGKDVFGSVSDNDVKRKTHDTFTYSEVENVHNIFVPYMYDLDLDECMYIFWAGYLGVTTKHLAATRVERYIESDDDIFTNKDNFDWTDDSVYDCTFSYGE